jgi:hypothetical protein
LGLTPLGGSQNSKVKTKRNDDKLLDLLIMLIMKLWNEYLGILL